MTEQVSLRFRGLMLEKFMKQALTEGVFFFRVSREGRDGALLVTDGPGAKTLLQLARRYQLDMQETGRQGIKPFLCRLARRWTLAAALILWGLIAFFLLSRLWFIDVHLLDGAGDAGPLHQALDQMGVRPGMAMKDIESGALSLSLQARCPEYAYVGIQARGVHLQVEAAQAQQAPSLYDARAARDLVASRDALLISLDVAAGTAAVKPGQVVKKGQVLIRGEERDGRDTTRGVAAMGTAIGRVWLTGEARSSLTRQVFQDTGRVRYSRSLKLLSWQLPLLQGEPFSLERTQTRRLPVGGLLLPLHIEETAHIEQKAVMQRLDLQSLQAEIGKIAMNNAFSLLPEGIWPVDKWVDYSMIEGDIVRARAVVEIQPNIAVSRADLAP